MEFLFFWLGTSATCFGIEIANELRMFKDVADAGYKINVDRISELGNQLNPDASKITFISMLIPIFNIIQVFQRIIQYNNVRPMILNQLSVIGALEEMTELEKSEYLKNPTSLNALLVPLKSEIKIAKAFTLKINDDNDISEIFYEIGESIEDITILKVNGTLSRLTPEQQKEKVIQNLKYIEQPVVQCSIDKENLEQDLNNNHNIDLVTNLDNKKDDDSYPTKLSTNEQKTELENLKNKLLNEKYSSLETKTNNELKLTKKRKYK